MSTKLYWIHALTPVHVGSGQGVGFIDMPIMREKTTKLAVDSGICRQRGDEGLLGR